MGHGTRERTPTQLLAALHELRRKHARMTQRLGQIEEESDAILLNMTELSEELAAILGDPDTARSHVAAPAPHAKATSMLRQAAQLGVSDVGIRRMDDEAAWVQVDGAPECQLSPALTDLLEVLVEDNGKSSDRMVGWKTIAEITRGLGARMGHRVKKHAVSQLVYRLKRELSDRAGINPYLIQTNRRKGIRFALRRKPPAAVATECKDVPEESLPAAG